MFGLEYSWHMALAVAVFTALLLLVPFYVVRRRKKLAELPSLRASVNSASVEHVRFGLLFVGLLAAGAIQLGYKNERMIVVPVLEGLEIAAMVDCSQSMLAPVGGGDFTPRLTVVISALENSLQSLKKDRWGLGCFSQVLNGVSPLTHDFEHLLRPKLEVMQDPRYIGVVGVGSNFGAGIEGCMKILKMDNPSKTKKVCIILSDGEPQGDEAKLRNSLAEYVAKMKSAIAARKLDVAFYLVGVGDPSEEFRIPLYDSAGNPKGFVVGKDGRPSVTRPDPEYLQRIAHQFQGEYIHLKSGEKLLRLLDDIMNAERRKIGERLELTTTDVTTELVILLIICFVVFLKFPRLFSFLKKRTG